jgi:indole-3-glycerol phosphate synthase
MLEKFAAAKQAEIRMLEERREAGSLPSPWQGARPDFVRALIDSSPVAVIAEYKRASPSMGDINLGLDPAGAARAYASARAAAMSVLTETEYFKGDLAHLEEAAVAGLPLLRKDFIIHDLQVEATAATPASAVLLIARMLYPDDLKRLLALSRSLGLAPVVEVFDAVDLEVARQSGADIIQVNNRDLDTLKVNLNNSLDLARHRGENEVWISASGIRLHDHVLRLARAGFNAVLVGTTLMAGSDPARALAGLRGVESPG